jgi:Fur family peroxide stress response transcriptional regulator
MSAVYHTPDMMKKEGLIRELEYYDMENRYEIDVSDHINLVCTKCREITDFMGNVPSFSNAVEKETGIKSSNMRFEYYGICRNCAALEGWWFFV